MMDGKSGYLGHSLMPLYFGLGEATSIEQIEITWPSGKRQTMTDGLLPNKQLVIQEPAE
jgi:hypothetical protein